MLDDGEGGRFNRSGSWILNRGKCISLSENDVGLSFELIPLCETRVAFTFYVLGLSWLGAGHLDFDFDFFESQTQTQSQIQIQGQTSSARHNGPTDLFEVALWPRHNLSDGCGHLRIQRISQ